MTHVIDGIFDENPGGGKIGGGYIPGPKSVLKEYLNSSRIDFTYKPKKVKSSDNRGTELG
jgi:hypothetical protein